MDKINTPIFPGATFRLSSDSSTFPRLISHLHNNFCAIVELNATVKPLKNILTNHARIHLLRSNFSIIKIIYDYQKNYKIFAYMALFYLNLIS